MSEVVLKLRACSFLLLFRKRPISAGRNSISGAKSVDVGDLTERRILRENLQCRNFRWYLEHVYPESPIPIDFLSLGKVYSIYISYICSFTQNLSD